MKSPPFEVSLPRNWVRMPKRYTAGWVLFGGIAFPSDRKDGKPLEINQLYPDEIEYDEKIIKEYITDFNKHEMALLRSYHLRVL